MIVEEGEKIEGEWKLYIWIYEFKILKKQMNVIG